MPMEKRIIHASEQLRKLGDRVRSLRRKHNISQEKLAEIAGVHRTYIGMIERGEKNVTLVTLLRLAKALGVSPAELLEGF